MEKKWLNYQEVGHLLEAQRVAFDGHAKAANPSYGAVGYWAIPDGSYLLCRTKGNRKKFFITDIRGITDLLEWLEDASLYGTAEGIEQQANVRGSTSLKLASPDDQKGEFYTLTVRYWVNCTSSSTITRDDQGKPYDFGSYQAAKEWVDRMENPIYLLEPKEALKPDYKIIRINPKGN